jgi:hypothetical protein
MRHVFDMTDMGWERKATKNAPPARYGHSSIYISGQLYVYGGCTTNGVLNDLFVLNTRDWTWKQIRVNNSFPLYLCVSPFHPLPQYSEMSLECLYILSHDVTIV